MDNISKNSFNENSSLNEKIMKNISNEKRQFENIVNFYPSFLNEENQICNNSNFNQKEETNVTAIDAIDDFLKTI
jgi:hypothetical protein